jgi:hypothetical protein
MSEPKCETCRWWKRYPRSAVDTSEGHYGDCKRRAPCVMTYHPGGYTDTVDHETRWATTEAQDFCGEHAPKEKNDE